MNPFHLTVLSAMRHPRRTLWSAGLVTFVLLFAFPFVQVDVDPESMLAQDEPVRVEHHQIKARMELYDMLVLAVTYDEHADGVFNPGSLARLQRLSAYIATLDGVVAHELLTPDNIDAIEPGRPGSVRFERVMPQPPLERAGALKVRQRLIDNPFLWKTMVSTDRKALAIYIPISAKEHSWRIASQTKQKIAQINGPEAYHLAGLPVAEDTFGVEMFIQMAISAPLAMLFIATLIWFFVRNLWLTGATLLLAMLSVLITMGAFIASGQTLHIMSSMIPIFIMPIAVLDAVHILSQFFDGYTGDRRESLRRVMQDLWQPMLFTSLTTSAGFLSLVWAPIPPIQAFGLFTGLGILVAWLLSMTFLPAFICLLPDTALSHFGARARAVRRDWLGRLLNGMRRTAISRPTWTLGLTLAFAAIAIFGLNRLQINDNPVKWFAPQHEIRVADRLINERFGGSYLVYLSLEQPFTTEDQEALRQRLNPLLLAIGEEGKSLHDWISQQAATFSSPVALLDGARQWLQGQIVGVPAIAGGQPSMSDAPAFEMESTPVDSGRRQRLLQLDELLASSALPYQIMKRPEVLAWMDRMAEEAHIGAVHSVANLVKKVNKELHEGRAENFRIPDTATQVMETYISFQSSHDLNRLWHMVTPDYAGATLLIQLRAGDNQDVATAVAGLRQWITLNPPPVMLRQTWSGLAYLNIIWQEKMVNGMLMALIGSLLVVLAMMLYLYRCFWWALLSVLPLSLSILLVYGSIGLLGKDYDMPVAVLSALALGLAVDFAIHFITHVRLYARQSPPRLALAKVFGDPGRGIMRNAVVITLGFTPLLLAPLVPYQTVGYLMMSIMLISGVATFFILPALLGLGFLRPVLFPGAHEDPADICLFTPLCQKLIGDAEGGPCKECKRDWRQPELALPLTQQESTL